MTRFVFIAVITFAEVSASRPEDWAQVLLQYGGLGIMLLWFMLRMENRMDAQLKSDARKTTAINHNALSQLTAIAALRNLDANVTDLAARLAEQIEATNKLNENENSSD